MSTTLHIKISPSPTFRKSIIKRECQSPSELSTVRSLNKDPQENPHTAATTTGKKDIDDQLDNDTNLLQSLKNLVRTKRASNLNNQLASPGSNKGKLDEFDESMNLINIATTNNNNNFNLNEFVTQNTEAFLNKLKELTLEVKDLRSPYQHYYVDDQLVRKNTKIKKLGENYGFFRIQSPKSSSKNRILSSKSMKKTNEEIYTNKNNNNKSSSQKILETPLVDSAHENKTKLDPYQLARHHKFIQNLEERISTAISSEIKTTKNTRENSLMSSLNSPSMKAFTAFGNESASIAVHDMYRKSKIHRDFNNNLEYTKNNRKRLLYTVMKNREALSPNKSSTIQIGDNFENNVDSDFNTEIFKKSSNSELEKKHKQDEKMKRSSELVNRKSSIYYEMMALDPKSKGKILVKLKDKVPKNSRFLQI